MSYETHSSWNRRAANKVVLKVAKHIKVHHSSRFTPFQAGYQMSESGILPDGQVVRPIRWSRVNGCDWTFRQMIIIEEVHRPSQSFPTALLTSVTWFFRRTGVVRGSRGKPVFEDVQLPTREGVSTTSGVTLPRPGGNQYHQNTC